MGWLYGGRAGKTPEDRRRCIDDDFESGGKYQVLASAVVRSDAAGYYEYYCALQGDDGGDAIVVPQIYLLDFRDPDEVGEKYIGGIDLLYTRCPPKVLDLLPPNRGSFRRWLWEEMCRGKLPKQPLLSELWKLSSRDYEEWSLEEGKAWVRATMLRLKAEAKAARKAAVQDGEYFVLKDGSYFTIENKRYTRFKLIDKKLGLLRQVTDDGFEEEPKAFRARNIRKVIGLIEAHSPNLLDVCPEASFSIRQKFEKLFPIANARVQQPSLFDFALAA